MQAACKLLKTSVLAFAISTILFVSAKGTCGAHSATPAIKTEDKVSGFGECVGKISSAFNSVPFHYKMLALTVFLAAYRFNMKYPSNKKARYDWSKLNPKNLLSDPKTFFKHAWYVLDDFVIGRAGEGKCVHGKEVGGGTIVLEPCVGHLPQGIGGHLHEHVLFPLASTFKFPITILASLSAFAAGADAWGKYFGNEPAIAVVKK